MSKPFLKWPGSKAWLIDRLNGLLPSNFSRVVEPFSGSAAFYLGSQYSSAMLADANDQVVQCLIAVRDNPKELVNYLSGLNNTIEDYFRVRSKTPNSIIEVAGRLIFLTNTSWGGMYRENRKGEFNVPFGNNGRAFFCEQTIKLASEKLRDVELRNWGYERTISKSTSSDLLFIDPPYVTNGERKHFDRYHASGFYWSDQVSLAKILTDRSLRRHKIMVTCAAEPDLYELFAGWRVFEFSKRNSMTAYMGRAAYRKEALLLSPMLKDLAGLIEVNASIRS